MARLPQRRPKIDANAIGTTGLRENAGYVDEEFLAVLRGDRGRRLYREMEDNDPVIGAMLFAVTMLLRNAPWRVEPADDSAQAEGMAAWVEAMLFDDMEHTWQEFVDELTSMFTFGFAFHEMLWRRGPDGRWWVRGLPLRAQQSITEWDIDRGTGDILAAIQTTDDGFHATIPMERGLLFRTTRQKNNPEGRSILRNSVVPWQRKKIVEEAEGSAAVRSSGIVEIRMPASYMEPDADGNEQAVLAKYKAIADDLAKNKRGGIILPSSRDQEHGEYEFGFRYVTADNQRPANMGEIVERIDRRMATSILAQWVFLGQQSVGSFALSSDQTELFANALKAWLGGVQAEINRKLIPTIWRVNGMSEALMPMMKHGDVETKDLVKLGDYVRSIAGAGVLDGPDAELDNALRREAGLPMRADDPAA